MHHLVTQILLVASISLTGNKTLNHDSNTAPERPYAATEEKAPDFQIESVDGETISLKKSIEEGKPTVIYFTASWCPKCAKNWPTLSEAYEEYKDRINIIAVSIDPTDDASVMKKLAKEREISFPVAAGDPKLMVKLGVSGQATTMGISAQGEVAFRKTAVMSTQDYRVLFDELLKA